MSLAHRLYHGETHFDFVGRRRQWYTLSAVLLQPRLTPSLPTGPGSTTYQRIISGPGGVDPYAAAVSDVYQDLFEGGSYTGKGIYDVDIFEAALAGKVPENALLSHDLFEGVFARAGLLTDVDLFEEFPTNYEVAARRHHRWVRGDWQLLPWILGFARDAAGRKEAARIPTEGRWKMVDNLRRSLVAPSALLVLVSAWTVPDVPALLWASLILASLAVPAFIPVLDNLGPRRSRISKRSHVRAVGRDLVVASSQTLLAVTMLAPSKSPVPIVVSQRCSARDSGAGPGSVSGSPSGVSVRSSCERCAQPSVPSASRTLIQSVRRRSRLTGAPRSTTCVTGKPRPGPVRISMNGSFTCSRSALAGRDHSPGSSSTQHSPRKRARRRSSTAAIVSPNCSCRLPDPAA